MTDIESPMSLTHFDGRPPPEIPSSSVPTESPELEGAAGPEGTQRPSETGEPEGTQRPSETGEPEEVEEVEETSESEGPPATIGPEGVSETAEAAGLTQEQQLERWFQRDPNEDPEMHALRVRYTQALLAIPDILTGSLIPSAPAPIDIQTAVVLGFMVVKKARYNISYDPATEQIIAHVNRRLRLEIEYAPGGAGYHRAQTHYTSITQPSPNPS